MAFGGLTNWFKKRLEGAVAQVNLFDNGKTYNTVLQNRPPQQAPRQQVQPQQQFYNQPPSYGGGLNGLSNLFKDVFDANTPQDQYKRLSVGAPKDYVRQQAKLNQQAQQDPIRRNGIEQFSKNTIGGLASFAGKIPGSVADLAGSYDKSPLGRVTNLVSPLGQEKYLVNITKDLIQHKPIGTNYNQQATDLQRFGEQSQKLVDNKLQQSSFSQKKNDNKWIAGTGQAIGNVGGQVATTVATGGSTVIPAVLAGSQTFSQQRQAAKQAGKSDNEAFGIAALQAFVEGATEKIGLDKLKLPGAGNFAVKTLKRFGTEGAQEAGQQFAQNLITNRTYDRNQGLTQGVKEAGLFGGIAGGAVGSVFDVNPKQFQQNNQQLVAGQGGFVRVPGQKTELLATHNLTSDNLKKAAEIGGIPQPSLAIVNPKVDSVENFGDITLLGNNQLVDPKIRSNKVFGSDVYSPRQPKSQILANTDESVKKIREKLEPYFKQTGEYMDVEPGSAIDNIEGRVATGMAFLDDAKIKYNKKLEGYDLGKEIRDKIYQGNNKQKFRNWVEALYKDSGAESKIFGGYTNMGRKRLLDDTLDNALKVMRKEKIRSGEGGFQTGTAGEIRSRITPQFKSIKQILDAKNKLTTSEKMKAIKDTTQDKLHSFTEKLDKYATNKDSNQFTEYDRQLDAIGSYLKGEEQWFNNKFVNVPNSVIKELDSFKSELINAPTEYFEAVPDRAVSLNEFETAVVPEGTDKDVIKILNDNGLSIRYYKPTEGEAGARQESLIELLDEDNQKRFPVKEQDINQGGYINIGKNVNQPQSDNDVTERMMLDYFKSKPAVEGNALTGQGVNTPTSLSPEAKAKLIAEARTKVETPNIFNDQRGSIPIEETPNTPTRTLEQISASQSELAQRIISAKQSGDTKAIPKLKEELDAIKTELDNAQSSLTTPLKPKGFIIKETKPRGGKVDTVRITKDPVTGKMIKTIQSEDAPTPKDPYIKEYADMLRDMESGLTGGQLISDNQGGKTRITEHSPFYRQVFKEKGRKPTRAEWYEEAQRQVEEGSADPAFMEYYNDVNSKRGALSNTVKVIDNKPSNKPSQAEWDALLAQAEREGIEPSKKALLKIRAENNQNIADAVMAGDTEYANQLRDQAKDVSAKIRISANENNPNTAPDIPEATPTQVRDLRDKQTKADFETYTKQYLGDTRSAKIERDSTIVGLNKKHKLTNEEKLNAIVAADDPTVEPMNQKVENYLKDFRQLTDEAYRYYTQDRGIKMGFVSSYLPRIYRNPANGQAISGQEYKLLQQGSARQREREAETLYEDALIYKDPTKLLDSYYKSLDQAAAGQAYMQNLEKNGLVVASSENVRGLRPILAEGIQTPDGMHYYANKDVATKLNTMFGNREASNVVEKLMEKAAGINSVMQSFVLSGGIPNTPINAFGIMQVMKESMALHPIKAGKAFYVGMNKSAANNLFTKKKDILKLMAENDVNPRVDLQEVSKRGYVRIAEADNKVNSAWNEFTNDATFKRFMPALEILHFEQMYKAQLRKTGDSAKAAQIAADSVKNFYGKVSDYKQSTRAQLVDDTSGALLFAPRFRESMLNFWGKNIKALGHPTKPEYRDNIKFLIAAAVVYGAMEGLNKELNGVWMHDNPDGKKDKLLIPADKLKSLGINTEGKDIGVPFLSSISTIPRNAIFGAANLATGNFKEAGKNAKTALSMPLNLAGDIVTNENYFGQPIVQEGSTPAQRFGQVASYAITGNMQPWLREGLNIAGQKLPDDVKKSFGIKKKSTVETISNATESPFRFYDPKYYRYGDSWTPRGGKGEKFTISEQRGRAEIKKEMNSIPDSLGLSNTQKAKYKSLNSYDFDEKGNLKLDNNPFYQAQRATALQDDGVFEAMRQKAVLENKLNGKPLDPIYNLSPSERRVILWKKTLPQGTQDPTISKLYDQEWYQDYRGEEDRYFREKSGYNKKMGYDNAKDDTNPYPEPSKGLAKKLDYYYTLPKGTGARSAFLNSNPDVLAQWDKVENWKNGERAQVGLGPLDEYESKYAYGSKSGYSRSRSGRKGSRGGRKSKSPNLPSFTIANYPRVNKVKISSKKAPSTTLKVPTVKIKTSKAKITIAKQAKKIKKTSSMV